MPSEVAVTMALGSRAFRSSPANVKSSGGADFRPWAVIEGIVLSRTIPA